MQYNVTTKQGNNFIVDDQDIPLWLDIERKSGKTYSEFEALRLRGSLEANAWIMFCGAIRGGHTELKTLDMWIQHEFEDFELVDDDPKAETETASPDDSSN